MNTTYSDLDEVFALWASHEDFEPDDEYPLSAAERFEQEPVFELDFTGGASCSF